MFDPLDGCNGDLFESIGKLCGWTASEKDELRSEVNRLAGTVLNESPDQWPSLMAQVLNRQGFRPNGELPGFDLRRLMSQKCGNCVEYSVLWLLLSKKCGVALTLVRVPTHMFARFNPHSTSPVNIETMGGGMCITDDQYADRFCVTERQRMKNTYLADLTEEDVLGEIIQKALYAGLKSGASIDVSVREKARWVFRHHRMPSDLFNAIGLNYLIRSPKLAVKWLEAAHRLDPDFVPVFSNYVQSLVCVGRYADVIDVCDDTSPRLWYQNVPIVLNFLRSLIREGQYARFEYVCAECSLGQENCLPYKAIVAYLTGRFPEAAKLSRIWAETSGAFALGFVWEASALSSMGRRDFSEAPYSISRYYHDLIEMFKGKLSPQEIFTLHPNEVNLSFTYVAEYYKSRDLREARNYWHKAASTLKINCFEHLRAHRCLIDTNQEPASTGENACE